MLVEASIEKSKPVVLPLLDKAEKILSGSSSFEEAQNNLTELVSQEFIESFAEEVFQSLQEADALGRSNIIQKDLSFSEKAKVASARLAWGKFNISASGMNWFIAADDRVKLSFDLVPEEAVQAMREKSFWISGIENQELLDAIQKKLEEALKEGKSYKDFAPDVRKMIDEVGYSGESPLRLSTVFRTNLYSAYSMGQMSQVDGMRDRFPMWRYVAIHDNRTRTSHLELDGKIFKVGEGPVPPIDYNCRCSAQYLHVSQTADLEPMSANDTGKFLNRLDLKPFDFQKEYEKWLANRKEGMNDRIKETVKSLAN